MLLFELLGSLFQFDAREPACVPLFQLAPSSTASIRTHTHVQRLAFCQAPTILPTSAKCTEATSC